MRSLFINLPYATGHLHRFCFCWISNVFTLAKMGRGGRVQGEVEWSGVGQMAKYLKTFFFCTSLATDGFGPFESFLLAIDLVVGFVAVDLAVCESVFTSLCLSVRH